MLKRYDQVQTPYQRLLASGMLSKTERKRVDLLYQALNPLQLRGKIDDALRSLWQMVEQDPRTEAEITKLAELDYVGNP